MKLWLRFAALWITLSLIGFAVGFFVLRDGLNRVQCVPYRAPHERFTYSTEMTV
jgi:hypothetical protein